MREKVRHFLILKNIFSHENEGILICNVSGAKQGLELAKSLLYELVDNRTALYLSGGSTPKPLYETLAWEEKLNPGIVGLIDERYGEPLHNHSNEKMLILSGLIRYFSMLDIPYYPILRGVSLEETAKRYDNLYRSLGTVYRQSIGILGIGKDGHIAGIAPERHGFHNRLFDKENLYDMVSWFTDHDGPFKARVTMTFLGLTMLDFLIVLAFGEEKKEALQDMFELQAAGEEEIPARFFRQQSIAPKTLLITDQKV